MANEYFEHAFEHALAVCKKCRYSVLPSHIKSHLQRTHCVSRKKAEWAAEDVGSWAGLIQYASELEVPSQAIKPIHLLPVYADGLMCQIDAGSCCQIFRSRHAIKNHWRQGHSWSAAGKGGRPSQTEQKKIQDYIRKSCKTVYCQRVFVQGQGSQYFEVQPPNPGRQL
jgi:hypothetical protein